MPNWYWILIGLIVAWGIFKLGWEKGVSDTLKYFQTHPIPEDWVERR